MTNINKNPVALQENVIYLNKTTVTTRQLYVGKKENTEINYLSKNSFYMALSKFYGCNALIVQNI